MNTFIYIFLVLSLVYFCLFVIFILRVYFMHNKLIYSTRQKGIIYWVSCDQLKNKVMVYNFLICFYFTLFGSVVLCLLIELRKWNLNKMVANMNQPKQYPFIGIGHRFIGKDNEAIMELIAAMFRNEKTPVKAWFGPMLIIGISNPEDMKTILMSDNCLQKGYMYKFMHNITGIFTSDVDIWRQHRRMLNSTFNPKVLQSFIPTINKKSQHMCDDLEKQIKDGDGVDMYKAIFLCTFDVTINTLMSTSMNLQNDEGISIYISFTRAFESVARRMFRFWERPDTIYKRTKAYKEEMKHFQVGYDFIRKIRDLKIKEINEKLCNGEDILENEKNENKLTYMHKCFLLWRDGIFNEQNLFDEIETILIGGIDTTSVAMSGIIMMLAMHPLIQERVYLEILDVFGNNDGENENNNIPINLINQESLSKLTYLHMCIQESLRLLPAGPYLSRTCVEPLKLKNNIIPKSAVILLLFDKMNRDPDIWGDSPHLFNPDRFLPDMIAKRHPWSFLPFSGGPRNCIGIKHAFVSVRIMLINILTRFKISTNLSMSDLRIKMDVTLKIVNENPIQLIPRKIKNIL